jgi:hypothetical protein
LAALVPPDRREWLVVNDNVMGGRSLGALEVTPTSVVFAGELNTNSGGFASIRSRGLLTALSPFTAVVLRIHGDGREWACDFRAAATSRGFSVTWKATFPTSAGSTTMVRLPFSTFRPTWRGQLVPASRIPSGEAFPAAMQSVGFTIADGRDGAFRIEVLGVEGV